MRWKSHVRCGAGEKIEIISKSYLSLSDSKKENDGFDNPFGTNTTSDFEVSSSDDLPFWQEVIW